MLNDEVGNVIYFLPETMQEEQLERMSIMSLGETLGDERLAEVLIGRMKIMLNDADEQGKIPVIARQVADNVGNHYVEIAMFVSADPEVVRLPLPEGDMTEELSMAIFEMIHVVVAGINGYTDMTVCQILTGCAPDPWSLLGSRELN